LSLLTSSFNTSLIIFSHNMDLGASKLRSMCPFLAKASAQTVRTITSRSLAQLVAHPPNAKVLAAAHQCPIVSPAVEAQEAAIKSKRENHTQSRNYATLETSVNKGAKPQSNIISLFL
jgi:hypothetical protein